MDAKIVSFKDWWDTLHRPFSGSKKGYKNGAMDGWIACSKSYQDNVFLELEKLEKQLDIASAALEKYAKTCPGDSGVMSVAREALNEIEAIREGGMMFEKIRRYFSNKEYVYLEPKDYGIPLTPNSTISLDVECAVKDNKVLIIMNNRKETIYICSKELKEGNDE